MIPTEIFPKPDTLWAFRDLRRRYVYFKLGRVFIDHGLTPRIPWKDRPERTVSRIFFYPKTGKFPIILEGGASELLHTCDAIVGYLESTLHCDYQGTGSRLYNQPGFMHHMWEISLYRSGLGRRSYIRSNLVKILPSYTPCYMRSDAGEEPIGSVEFYPKGGTH